MTDYDNTNTGIISKNDRKEKDSHPDINGTLNVEGVEYWINGWQKKRKSDGGTFYSLSVKRKQERAQEIVNDSRREDFGGDIDDEIPFAAEWRI